MGSNTAAPTVSLEDESATDPALTGGKAANLARLVDAGFSVPPGFCVTTDAYRGLVDDPQIRRAIRSLETLDSTDASAIAETSARIRERIANAEFPDSVRRAVEAAVAESGAESFSVRSSATAEDLPTTSFAGQHETYLNVSPTAVLDRVRDCMASLFTERAVTYRLQNGVSGPGVALAVVVQAMVDADVAGVLFTADPVTENRHVASIDANYGLGESIVAGDVSADNVTVDRRNGAVLSYDVGAKSTRVQSREAGGVEHVPVEAAVTRERALSHRRIRRLVDVGEEIEALFGTPQDVEWAFVDDELFVLQSRPITSLFPLVSPPPTDGLLHAYLSFGHQQAMPAALPPLVVAFWRSFLDDAALRFRAPETGGVSAEAGGRVYIDLTPLVRLGPLRRTLPGALSNLSEPAADGLRSLLAARNEDIPERGRVESIATAIRAIRRAGPPLRSTLGRVLSQGARSFVFGMPALDEMWDWSRTWGEGKADRIRSPATVRGRVDAAFDTVGMANFLKDIAPKGASFLPGIVAVLLLRRLFPENGDELDALGKGFEDEVVTRMNQALGELADTARDSPAVVDALESGASLDEIRNVDGGRDFAAQFDAFLDLFGHRATGEIDLRQPRWRDDPSVLLRTVQSNVEHGTRGTHRKHLRGLESNAETAQATVEALADSGVFGPVRTRFVRYLIRGYRNAIPVREFPKQGMAHAFAAAHDVFTEAGEALASSGRIERPDDVWFLRRDELVGALAGEPISADVESRRRTYERYAKLTAPPLLTSDGERPSATTAQRADANTLVGTPVSSGVVEGVARVVVDPAAGRLESGEILVAPSTDPGWTPLFLNAAGLVMEVGGRMTHGALVAREYGIPAVASISNATTEIRTGDRIRLDGKRGTVELLDRESSGASVDDGTTR